MLYLWIVLTVLGIIGEALTTELIAIWFVPAGIVAAVLSFCNVAPIWQVLTFFVLSAVGIVLSIFFLRKFRKEKDTKTNIDAIIGEKCIVTERIDNYAGCGQAKVKGQVWSARSTSDDVTFEAGEVLTVVAIEGVKLICKKN